MLVTVIVEIGVAPTVGAAQTPPHALSSALLAPCREEVATEVRDEAACILTDGIGCQSRATEPCRRAARGALLTERWSAAAARSLLRDWRRCVAADRDHPLSVFVLWNAMIERTAPPAVLRQMYDALTAIRPSLFVRDVLRWGLVRGRARPFACDDWGAEFTLQPREGIASPSDRRLFTPACVTAVRADIRLYEFATDLPREELDPPVRPAHCAFGVWVHALYMVTLESDLMDTTRGWVGYYYGVIWPMPTMLWGAVAESNLTDGVLWREGRQRLPSAPRDEEIIPSGPMRASAWWNPD